MRVELVRRDGKVLGQLVLAEGVTVHEVNLAALSPAGLSAAESAIPAEEPPQSSAKRK